MGKFALYAELKQLGNITTAWLVAKLLSNEMMQLPATYPKQQHLLLVIYFYKGNRLQRV